MNLDSFHSHNNLNVGYIQHFVLKIHFYGDGMVVQDIYVKFVIHRFYLNKLKLMLMHINWLDSR